jgi:hypothetical protein
MKNEEIEIAPYIYGLVVHIVCRILSLKAYLPESKFKRVLIRAQSLDILHVIIASDTNENRNSIDSVLEKRISNLYDLAVAGGSIPEHAVNAGVHLALVHALQPAELAPPTH